MPGLLAVLVMAAMLAVQTPRVQDKVSHMVAEKLQAGMDADLSFTSIRFMPFNMILIKDIAVVDRHPYTEDRYGRGWAPADTFCRARTISATLTLKGLLNLRNEGIHLKRVSVEDGLMHLVTEPDSEYSTNLQRIFRIKSTGKKNEPGGNIFDIRKVRVTNFRYRMNSFKSTKLHHSGHGINYDDLDVRCNIKGHDLKFSGGRMYGVCDAMSAYEKSGCVISKLTGDCVVGMGKTLVRNLHLVDPMSDLRAKYYTMTYENAHSFSDYISKVKMEVDLKPSRIAMETVMYFACGALYGNKAVLDVSKGHMCGYVNDFEVDGLEFRDAYSGVSGKGDATLIGIPDVQGMGLKYDVKGLDFDTDGLSKFICCWAPSANLDLSKFAAGERFNLDCKGHGTLDRMTAEATLRNGNGTMDLDLDLRNLISRDRDIEIFGTADARDIDAGRLSGIDALGECTLRTGLHASFGQGGTSVRVDSLKVDRFSAMGYDYSGIAAAGTYDGDHFDGKLVCSDPNLKFIFQGIVSLSKKTSNALYKFYANLAYADLKALNLDNRGDRSKASCEVEANFRSFKKADLLGDIFVRNVVLENDEGVHDIGDISIRSHSDNNLNRMQLKSSFMDGGFVGGRSLSALVDDLQNITTRRHLPALYDAKSRKTGDSADYDISFNFHDSRDLLSFILPGAYIADSTSISLKVSDGQKLIGRVESGRIAFGKNYLRNVNMDLDNIDGSLNCIVTSDEFSVSGLGFKNPALTAYGENDSFSLGFHYDGIASVDNVGEIYLNGELTRDESDSLVVTARPLSSYIRMEDEVWNIGEAEIRLRGGDISVDNFHLSCDEQLLSLDGGFSRSHVDTLRLSLDRVGLDLVNRFIEKDYGFDGKASGKVLVTSPVGKDLGLLLNIGCDSLSVGGIDAGSIRLASAWDETDEKFDVYLKEIVEGHDALNVRGNYVPASRHIRMSAEADQMKMALIQPFLASVFSEVSGGLDGRVEVNGHLDSLALSSNGLNFDNVMMKLGITGVQYTVNGPFHIADDGLFFDSVRISDSFGGRGDLVGALRYDRLKDVAMDMSLRLRNMKVLNMTQDENRGVYGDLAVNGLVSLTGPLNSIFADADIRTSGTGRVNVPIGLGSASAGNRSDLLTFKEREVYLDPYEQMMQNFSEKKKSTSNFALHAKVGITPEVMANVDMDSGMRNQIKASGTGSIILDVHPAKDVFSIDGDYILNSGSYLFELPGIVAKEFSISNGSSIKFGGDLMDTQLDINAIHSLKTSLSRLLGEDQSASTRRTVDCGINISDQLSNPRLGFSITIPDLDPTTRAQVESALNTEDKVQKQFVSLLLLGSFLPSENSGIINGSSMLYSNVSEIMANQLNNILQKLEIPLDLGFGYQANDGGTDIFDVAISTQLFNNRVVVNGSVGNRKYSTSTNANGDMVGDLDIEVKLDKPGQFRLNLFSHSADEYSSYLDYSQRNGIGVAYQKEYNKFSDFVRSIFHRRTERERRRNDQQMNTIKIEDNE